MISLASVLSDSPYIAYSYAYPHKTAYRPFEPPVPLEQVWAAEQREALFLYAHVPFCEYRCGFCNLFTAANPAAELPELYLQSLRRQAEATRDALGDLRFARLAIGGGTPTYLTTHQLEQLFGVIRDVMGARPADIPVSIETSPATVDAAKLRFLRDVGVDRLSIGIQSFDEVEARAMGRPQRREDVEKALDLIRKAGFPTLNLDLIYGAEGQSVESFRGSVRTTLAHEPEEIYLYPLYVRPLTGLGNLQHEWDDRRIDSYRAGRDLLLEHGYEQVSMRMFRSPNAPAESGPVYCCQQDGMIGLGCGARSYTRQLHYSSEFAVGRTSVRGIIGRFLERDHASFRQAEYGFALDEEDQARRWVIVSLLQCDGLQRDAYCQRFGTDVVQRFPELAELEARGLADIGSERIRLTSGGIERSDSIGPWLYSESVNALMEDYQLC